LRTLTTPPGGPISRWTPDSRGIAYYTIDPGGQVTHLTDNRIIEDFAWSRDGKRLAVSRSMTTNDIVLFKGLKR
jgi:hypothetical protein